MRRFLPFIVGAGLGTAYGVLCRLASARSDVFGILTCAFIFGVPGVMGYLAIRPIPSPRWWHKAFVSWIPWLVAVLFSAIVGAEGSICIVLATPAALAMATIGGFLGGSRPGHSRAVLPAVLAFPLALGPAETASSPSPDVRTVRSTIDVRASRQEVWEHVREVRAISRAELRDSFFDTIGFPRPVEATLVGAGVGSVRHARFERGVLFLERVTAWEEGRRLAFDIHADPTSIPASTLDPHVVIGSRHFDILNGEYVLEELPSGITRVHLTSHHRLTTTLAPYAGLWTDAIFSSVQRRILEVVRARCEKDGRDERTTSPSP